ncbi:MAG: PadR family transcriptional regulator [Nanoarchaeota archaeon]
MGEKCGCEMKGLLGFLLLFLLSKKKMCGREIADELEKRKGCRLSPGTLYPALAGLCNDGFIDEEKKGRICVYNITKKGKRAFKVAKTRFKKEFYGL